jgi:hypothetical protein
VPLEDGFDAFLIGRAEVKAAKRDDQEKQRVTDGMQAVTQVIEAGGPFWVAVRDFARANRLASPDDESALKIACAIPRKIPADWQAERLLKVRQRCEEAGFPASR